MCEKYRTILGYVLYKYENTQHLHRTKFFLLNRNPVGNLKECKWYALIKFPMCMKTEKKKKERRSMWYVSICTIVLGCFLSLACVCLPHLCFRCSPLTVADPESGCKRNVQEKERDLIVYFLLLCHLRVFATLGLQP